MLGDNCVFAHMNVLRDDEVEPIVRNGISIAWCPGASMMWAVGGTIHGRHAELYQRGVNVALGSDSSNWGTRFDIGLQGYLAVLTAREKLADRAALVAEDALAMATINGAKAVGLADRIGSLEAGQARRHRRARQRRARRRSRSPTRSRSSSTARARAPSTPS